MFQNKYTDTFYLVTKKGLFTQGFSTSSASLVPIATASAALITNMYFTDDQNTLIYTDGNKIYEENLITNIETVLVTADHGTKVQDILFNGRYLVYTEIPLDLTTSTYFGKILDIRTNTSTVFISRDRSVHPLITLIGFVTLP